MDELFAIDAQARQEGLSQSDRHVLRLEKSQPLLEQIKAGIQAARVGALPKSALAKACDYTLTLWTRLSRFLEYPELELSNNLAENAMRPIALGRKNWIHLGSKEAGPRVAAIISIVETCRRSAYQFATISALCFPVWPTFPSTESLNSRPSLGLSATNRRKPATPSTAPLVRRLPRRDAYPHCRPQADMRQNHFTPCTLAEPVSASVTLHRRPKPDILSNLESPLS